MIKTEKLLRLKNSSGRSIRVVREHYIREDVPCRSQLCLAGCDNNQTGSLSPLPSHVTHYLVPDANVSKYFLEILEYPEIVGIIFMHTVVHAVQHEAGRRVYNRLHGIVKDIRRKSVIFHNEFQRYAYCQREAKEDIEKWRSRSTYAGAVWYYNHLAGQMPVVMVTEDTDIIAEYGSKTLGIFVVSVADYLKNFWPLLTEAQDLYESLCLSLAETKNKGQDYLGYLPVDVLEGGIKSGRFLQGLFQVNRYNAQQEAFVTRSGTLSGGVKDSSGISDVFIYGSSARNRAVHGDMVVVELLPKAQWRGRSLKLRDTTEGEDEENNNEEKSQVLPTGHIVGVIQRNWTEYVCSFDKQDGQQRKSGKLLVIPFDYRISKIRISTRQAEMLADHRIVVRIDSWEVDSQYPNGHFVKSLGRIGDIETEVSAIFVTNDISVGPFSEGQMKELPSNSKDRPWLMDVEEVARRRDLRNSHLIFSIDPKGCEDVDDTLSVRALPNGHTELGVHIADVTYFVKPNTLTDLEARARSTTVYLADRRYDMLPEILSADLCSLISNVDRYAMSVMWELDSNYEVVDVWYGRTVIRSSYKLFYEIAQSMHDGLGKEELVANIPELQDLSADMLDTRLADLSAAVTSLMQIARRLKWKREQGGALQLEGVEVQVQLDDTKKIEDLVPKQHLEIHETIAECMIFANHWVAKKISESFPNQALLRHHPLPREEHFQELIHCGRAKGFLIDTNNNKALADSLDKCVDAKDTIVNKLLRTIATQAMSNALYFSTGSLARDQFFHYGLALDRYTHFTSPIRRYADVLVHRQLLAALGVDDPSNLFSNKELAEIAQHINNKHRAAQHAQRASQELFQALFFKDRDPQDESCIVDAVIFQLRTNGVIVFIPRYGMKGAVYLKDKEGQVVYVKDGEPLWTSGTLMQSDYDITVNTASASQTYRLFDHITVSIVLQQSHSHASSVKLNLLNNSAHLTTNEETGETSQHQKTDIIKEVRTAEEDHKEAEKNLLDLGSNFPQLKAAYGQTETDRSLYQLIETLRETALSDL